MNAAERNTTKPKLLIVARNKMQTPDYSCENGYDIRTIQELLGHSSVKTTMIYTHAANMGAGIRSPLDG